MLILQDTPPSQLYDLLHNETVIGITIAGLGGAIVRWLDRSLQQKTIIHDESEKLRSEFKELNELLQVQITAQSKLIDTLRDRIDDLEQEVVVWKDKYYTLLERSHFGEPPESTDPKTE